MAARCGDMIQLGHLVKDAEQFVEAKAAYTQAIKFAPEDPERLLHLAHLLKNQRCFAEANAAFK